jgi:hypothetical protein
MLGKDASAKELRSIVHQPEQGVLSVWANKRDIRQIDHQLSAVKLFSSPSPGALHFRCPGTNQFAFQYQPPLAVRFDDGDLEHWRNRFALDKSNGVANTRPPAEYM